MTDDIARAVDAHDAFEHTDDRYESTTTPFDATLAVEDDGDGLVVRVTVPDVGAAVEGSVGEAVAEGWFDAFERRIDDAYDVTRRADGETAVEWTREEGTVTVTLTYAVADPVTAVDDAAALVDFVEGTYLQGVIPGYDYVDPVAGLLSTARQNASGGPDADSADGPDAPDGTPL